MQLRAERGFSFIELLIVVAIIIVILTAAVPYYQEAVRNSREMAAMQAIRTLHAAQMQYYSQNDRFAASLGDLGGHWIPAELASGKKSGYHFRMDVTPDGFAIHAEPAKFDVTGSRTFFSDQTMVIRENRGREPATATSPEAR